MAAGDFTATKLMNIQLMSEKMWTDGVLARQGEPQAQAAIAVLQNQVARFGELNDRDKDLKIDVTFIDTCNLEDEACDDNCVIDEPLMETGKKNYVVDICRKSGFSVDAETSRTNAYETQEAAAAGLAKAIQNLDEYWARQVLTKLNTFSGYNAFPNPYTFDATAMTTEVEASNYNLSMAANLIIQARLNRLGTPYYIENGLLESEILNARFAAGNSDGKGDVARLGALNLYSDPLNFALAGISDTLFSVGTGAVAFKTVNRNPDTPIVLGGSVNQTRYTVNSRVLPGVKYDVYHTMKCVTGGRIVYSWKLETNGGVWLNPEGCPFDVDDGAGGTDTYQSTGVLSYTKTA